MKARHCLTGEVVNVVKALDTKVLGPVRCKDDFGKPVAWHPFAYTVKGKCGQFRATHMELAFIGQ